MIFSNGTKVCKPYGHIYTITGIFYDGGIPLYNGETINPLVDSLYKYVIMTQEFVEKNHLPEAGSLRMEA